jgi:phosphoglycolate phosphatase
MKYRLAIFDFDGTLATTLDSIHTCICEAFAAFGIRAPSREAVRATVGLTLEESVNILADGSVSTSRIHEVVKEYRRIHDVKGAAGVKLFEGAGKLLEELPSHNIKSVLVSNKGRKGLNDLLDRLRIRAFFDLTLSAEDVARNKPDPKLFSQDVTPHFSGIPTKETVVIGDTDVDIRFAKAAGLASCWASYGYGDEAKCRKLGPDYEARDLKELRDILRAGRAN